MLKKSKDSILLFGDLNFIKYIPNCLKQFNADVFFLIKDNQKNTYKQYITVSTNKVLFFKDIEDSLIIDFILKNDIAYLFTFITSIKIPNQIIKSVKKGSFNIHPSYLPHYRGPNPYFWCIRNKASFSGLSVHKLTHEYDRGDILAQIKFSLSKYETQGTYLSKMLHYLTPLFDIVYSNLNNPNYKFIVQKNGEYYKGFSKKEFYIDFSDKSSEVESLVRACNPYFKCYTRINNILLEVLQVSITTLPATVPGNQKIIENSFLVSCADYYISMDIIFVSKEGFFSGKRFIDYINAI